MQVESELQVVAGPVAEPQRRVASDRPLAVDDLADAIGRHADPSRELGRRGADHGEFVGEDLAGVDGGSRHG